MGTKKNELINSKKWIGRGGLWLTTFRLCRKKLHDTFLSGSPTITWIPILYFLFFYSSNLSAQYSEDIKVHDPVMIKQGDTYYIFATGNGISVFSSKDMKSWKPENKVFEKPPEWALQTVSGFTGHIWAPDISFYNGQYFLYYSISSFGKNTSAIGLAINKTLNPADADYKWIDQGMIVQSIPGRDLWNAIDPNIAMDNDGYSWMVFGSFWEGMKMVKLIPNRTALSKPEEWYTVAKKKRTAFLPDNKAGDAPIEAPFIFKKNARLPDGQGYYYLFVSWDYCCRGKESTYKVVVGRSKTITGPYLDKEGKSMFEGGGTLVMQGNDDYAGAGHNSAYTFDNKDYFVFHAYDLKDGGQSKLKIREMKWVDNWPVVDPL
jgi:arabinan endo-1,5-alpha-L-arabinosidase